MRVRDNMRFGTRTAALLAGALALLFVLSSACPQIAEGLSRRREQKKGGAEKSAEPDDGAEDRIVPGKRIGKFSMGMTLPEVYNAVKGVNPTNTQNYDDGSMLYTWGKTSVIISGKTGRINYIGTWDSQFATKEGVRSGDSQFNLEAKMGTPQRRERFPGEGPPEAILWALWYDHRSIRFLVRDGKISSIEIWPRD